MLTVDTLVAKTTTRLRASLIPTNMADMIENNIHIPDVLIMLFCDRHPDDKITTPTIIIKIPSHCFAIKRSPSMDTAKSTVNTGYVPNIALVMDSSPALTQ
jgi:hypothetical protein